jgi:formylmethanofuran dehydrogenase subunit E
MQRCDRCTGWISTEEHQSGNGFCGECVRRNNRDGAFIRCHKCHEPMTKADWNDQNGECYECFLNEQAKAGKIDTGGES